MRALLSRYGSALRCPGMIPVLVAMFIAYLLAGMMSLSLLLATERATGSYAAAGTVSGAYAVALALAAPVWGGVVDRRGARRPLAWAVALQALTVSGFVAVALTVRAGPLLAAAAAAAGACTPPTSTVAKRTMMTIDDDRLQRTLFAMSGFFTECVFVVGPLLVALIVLVAHPLWSVAAAAAASATGAAVMRSSGPARALRGSRRAGDAPAAPAGWSRRQVQVLAVVTLGAVAIGAVQVSVVAHAQRLGTSAGLFIAALAVGGVVASFLYGGLPVPGPLPTQLVASLGLYGALILTLAAAPALVPSLALLVLIGAATGPADAIEAMLLGRCTPPATQTRAFAVLITANWVGFALGSAGAGALVDDVALPAAVAAAGAAALVAAALVLVPVDRSAPTPNPTGTAAGAPAPAGTGGSGPVPPGPSAPPTEGAPDARADAM